MGKKRRVFKPALVSVTIEEEEVPFRITIDGTVYFIQQTEKYPKNEEEFMAAIVQKGSPPFTLTKETYYKVRNTRLQRYVFNEYLKQLEKSAESREEAEGG